MTENKTRAITATPRHAPLIAYLAEARVAVCDLLPLATAAPLREFLQESILQLDDYAEHGGGVHVIAVEVEDMAIALSRARLLVGKAKDAIERLQRVVAYCHQSIAEAK